MESININLEAINSWSKQHAQVQLKESRRQASFTC